MQGDTLGRLPKYSEPSEVLEEAASQGWRVDRGNRYWKMWCPCGEHMKTVHVSPSDPNYARNLVGQLRRATCWMEGR